MKQTTAKRYVKLTFKTEGKPKTVWAVEHAANSMYEIVDREGNERRIPHLVILSKSDVVRVVRADFDRKYGTLKAQA